LVVNHKDYEQRKDFDLALEKEINNIDVDLIVLAGFMRILGKSIIKKYHNRIINLHPSLLPKYPGLNTHLKVLENGDTYHGATVHLVDEGLDTGKIIGFSKFETNAQDSLDSLLAKTHEVEHKLLPKICCLIASGKITLDKGDVLIESKSYKKGKEFIF
jgi:phosphoribosylglycinamide formyltransferase-1